MISLAQHKMKREKNIEERNSGNSAVIHLPVAPQVTYRTRFASAVPKKLHFLMPKEAVSLLDSIMEQRGESVMMAAITGPGDPFAVPDTTLETVKLIKERYPHLDVGLKTLGIGSERFAREFADAGVTYIEMQVDGIKAEMLEKLYAWIRPGHKTLKISDAVTLMLEEQRHGVPALKYAGMRTSIVTTLFPGHNIDHIGRISERMMELGADSISLVPYRPETGAEVLLPLPDEGMIDKAERNAAKFLTVVDSILVMDDEQPAGKNDEIPGRPRPSGRKQRVAVVSSNGIDVDLHLGRAENILIYGPREDGLACLLETRKAPVSGGGENRWKQFSEMIDDCFVVLAASAGNSPRKVLSDYGISVIETDENIEGCVDVLYGGGRKKRKKRKE